MSYVPIILTCHECFNLICNFFTTFPSLVEMGFGSCCEQRQF